MRAVPQKPQPELLVVAEHTTQGAATTAPSDTKPTYDELLARVEQLEQQQQHAAIKAAALALTNATLQQSEGRYRRIMETTQEGFGELSVAGRIVSTNPQLDRMFGYQPGEMIGLMVADLDRFHIDAIGGR